MELQPYNLTVIPGVMELFTTSATNQEILDEAVTASQSCEVVIVGENLETDNPTIRAVVCKGVILQNNLPL